MVGTSIVSAFDGAVARRLIAGRTILFLGLHVVASVALLVPSLSMFEAADLTCQVHWDFTGERLFGLYDCYKVGADDDTAYGLPSLVVTLATVGVVTLTSLNLWFLWDRRRQSLFDKMLKTLVVVAAKSATTTLVSKPTGIDV